METQNPFNSISTRLDKIEMLLTEMHKVQTPKNSNSNSNSNSKTEYLSAEETAKFLGLSQGSIYRHVMNGVLTKRKFGNKLYFAKSELEALIEQPIK